MRGPARVGDADLAGGGGLLERLIEHAHLADRAEPGEMLRPVEHGDAGRIVAAVLEPPQTLHEDRYDIALGDCSNDSAHGFVPRLDALPAPKGAGGLDRRVCLKRTENADFAGESRDRGRVRRLSLVYRRLVKRIRAAPAPVSRGVRGQIARSEAECYRDVAARQALYSLFFSGFLVGRRHFSRVTCRARATVSPPAGTARVTVEPAAMVAPAPTVMGATSTLFEPVCTSSSMRVRCLLAPSWLATIVSAPISLSRITRPAPTRTRSPSATFPSSTTFTSMNTSLPWVTLPRKSTRAGSASVMPASMSSRVMRARHIPSSSASCALSFTPSTSLALGATSGLTAILSFTAMATTSVR